jgi:aminoglycoside N3'-acetyltransferase
MRPWISRLARRVRPAPRPVALDAIAGLLDDFAVRAEDLLVVYSSWESMHLRATPNELIELLLARLSRQGCLAFPTAPFDGRLLDYLLTKPVFNLRTSPSCRGLLSEVARRRRDARRTLHPGCPFSLLGPGQHSFARQQADFSSAYTEDAFLAECHRRNALILTLGLDFVQNSGVHYAEKRLDAKLGLFSRERLPFEVRDGEHLLRAETDYLFEAERDWDYIHREYRRRPSFREQELRGVSYSRVREHDSYEVFVEAIRKGKIRRRDQETTEAGA